MTTYKVNSIGTIYNNEKGAFIQLEAPYILALKELDGFSHINVLWWFSDFDNADFRSVLETDQPYKKAPENKVAGTPKSDCFISSRNYQY